MTSEDNAKANQQFELEPVAVSPLPLESFDRARECNTAVSYG